MASWFPKGDLGGSLGNPPAFRSSFQIRACMCLLVQRESKKDGVHNSAVCFWTSLPCLFLESPICLFFVSCFNVCEIEINGLISLFILVH